MNDFDTMTECPITYQKFKNIQLGKDSYYMVEFDGKPFEFFFCPSCFKNIPFDDIRHTIVGLMLNRLKPELHNQTLHWNSRHDDRGIDLKEVIETVDAPRTPKDKYDRLFTYLVKIQKYDGQRLNYDKIKLKWQYLYFKDFGEFEFYFSALQRDGLIESVDTRGLSGKSMDYYVTFKGISYYINLTKEGANSNKCFIAMAFDSSTDGIRKAIKAALTKTGYDPIIVDEAHVDSDKTINDAIIAGLRRCKFCIADFTLHRNGVYFESGFAVGEGKQVIYTCRKDEFAKAHFDIKPLQHIIYETPNELEKLLVDKIEAWIKPYSN